MEILRLLETSPIVRAYEVLDFRAFESGRYYKLKVEFSDGSVLHAREYTSRQERNYAYHWQGAKHTLRVRWDNAPHHSHLSTYPHHKHVGSNVLPGKETTFEDVLRHIESQLLDGD